ncbi:hypothetical protein NCG89_00875 [Spongiibacter taiwanensis]|uniref:hypothetical protein n=1 Tax=Spongiibacter taiwanensis TaxID=1748242 RepID=UPI002035CE79|nr:hypothetical protein [Spongiibacter taiwanensis]USA43356.1 hypothetical protein NCG89_00875 [Spongiibacter taiwanensis]
MSEFTQDPGVASYEELVAGGNALAIALLDVLLQVHREDEANNLMTIAAKPLSQWKALFDRTGFARLPPLSEGANHDR